MQYSFQKFYPLKKDAYYFPHDSNARHDEKVSFLISKYGISAYSLFWFFIEVMHESSDGKLTCSLVDGLSFTFKVDKDLLLQFYNDAIKIKLFFTDGKKYWSKRVLRNKHEFDIKKQKKSEAGKAGMQSRWGYNNSVITKHNGVITKHNKGKERKGKESIYIAPTLEEVKRYFIENGYSQKSSEKAYKYYNEANWFDGKGNKVKNWKQKMQGVWFKDENLENTEIKKQLSDKLPMHLKTLNPK